MTRTHTINTSVGCVKAATSIIGDKWTPQLLRHIANEGQVRFCRLQDLVGAINPRTLSARLMTLESRGIIEKKSDMKTNRGEYYLTSKGNDLLPILRDMQAWGEQHEAACTSVNPQTDTV